MLQDLRFALRLFRKHPAPVGIALGGLALAIGVVTAVFSLVNASMLRPYGMDDPASVVRVGRPSHGGWSQWAYARFRQLREGSTLSTIEASMPGRVRFSTVAADDTARSREVQFVSGGYLPMLGGRASRGRGLGPTDDTPGAPAVIVISGHFWKTELDSDPEVVGKTVWLNGSAVSIVGVLGPEFTGPVRIRPSLWAAFAAADDVLGGPAFDARTTNEVDVIARLAPGATTWAAQDQLSGVVSGWSTTGLNSPPANESGRLVRLSSAASPMDGPEDAESVFVLATTFGALGLVLALACANTANLLMAAAVTRAQEIGVRLALGASARRLLRQMVSESLLLGGLAGGLGFLFALGLAPILRAMIQLSPEIDIAPDGRVLLFTVAVALLCGVGCGLSPARYGMRGNFLSVLQSQSGSRSASPSSRFRTWFVGFQAAVSILLLVVASMLTRTAVARAQTDVGFDADRLLGVHFSVPSKGFDERVYMRAALAAARELQVVEGASLTQYPLFGDVMEHARVTQNDRSGRVSVSRTDSSYLATIGVRVLRGRPFQDIDVTGAAPVALISNSAARAIFGDADPIGQRLPHVSAWSDQEALMILGVVNDTVVDRLRSSDSVGAIYRPIAEPGRNPPGLLIRTANPGKAARVIEATLQPLDARVQMTTWVVQERLDSFLAGHKMLAWLAGPVAILAFLLAALGIYGLTSFVVSQRKEEVSIRLAIGASATDILRLLVTGRPAPGRRRTCRGPGGGVHCCATVCATALNRSVRRRGHQRCDCDGDGRSAPGGGPTGAAGGEARSGGCCGRDEHRRWSRLQASARRVPEAGRNARRRDPPGGRRYCLGRRTRIRRARGSV